MKNELLYNSNNPIPFIEAQIEIHQPTINEISLIGEKNFFIGCQVLTVSKNSLLISDKVVSESYSNFDIFMSAMQSREKVEHKNSVNMVLSLLFPECTIKVTNNAILLASPRTSTRITAENFDAFQDILKSMFDLGDFDMSLGNYDPYDERARKIAEKLNKGKEKIAKSRGTDEEKDIAIFSRYISILSVGLQKDKNELLNYNVFQLKDEFKRFQKKQSFDVYVQAKMAGAQNLDEIDNWMDELHS